MKFKLTVLNSVAILELLETCFTIYFPYLLIVFCVNRVIYRGLVEFLAFTN